MLKTMPADRARKLIAAAGRVPTSDPKVSYPAWYLHRWHFLPEGYLSRRSAAGYDHVIRRVYNHGLEARTIRRVTAEIERLAPDSVVEVGCGPGRLFKAMSERSLGGDLVGVDLSPYLLERARRRLGVHGGRLVHANGLDLPADEGAFDVAVAAHYVGHLPASLRSTAVAELARVVRPGGHVLAVEHRWHPWPESVALRRVRSSTMAPGFVEVIVFERTGEPGGLPR